MLLVFETLLGENGLFPGVAPGGCLIGDCKVLGSSGEVGGSVPTCTLRLVRPVESILRVSPMRGAAPFSLVAKLGLEVWPDIVDAP